jgi:hypothetical protein
LPDLLDELCRAYSRCERHLDMVALLRLSHRRRRREHFVAGLDDQAQVISGRRELGRGGREDHCAFAGERDVDDIALLVICDRHRLNLCAGEACRGHHHMLAVHGHALWRRVWDARLGHGPVYVSIDIDVLYPSQAPGTGTPEVAGITTRELFAVLRGLAATSSAATWWRTRPRTTTPASRASPRRTPPWSS